MSVAFLLNSLHCVGCLGLRGNFTDSPMTTGIFMILGFLVNLQSSYVPVVAQDLLVLRLKLIVSRFCYWCEEMTPDIFFRHPYMIDDIPHSEGLPHTWDDEGNLSCACSKNATLLTELNSL